MIEDTSLKAPKLFRARVALKEISLMTFVLPANDEECNAWISGRSIGLSGREISITHATPEYLSEPYEYRFLATEHGILLDEVDPVEATAYIKESNIHNAVKPDIHNAVTPESIDRYLFEHPLEEGVIAVLKKHGYVPELDMSSLTKVIGDVKPATLAASIQATNQSEIAGAELQKPFEASTVADSKPVDKVVSQFTQAKTIKA